MAMKLCQYQSRRFISPVAMSTIEITRSDTSQIISKSIRATLFSPREERNGVEIPGVRANNFMSLRFHRTDKTTIKLSSKTHSNKNQVIHRLESIELTFPRSPSR